MGFKDDLKRLFEKAIKDNGSNRKAALALGVNPVTFWGWTNGDRKKDEELYKAIDRAGGLLLVPGEEQKRYTPEQLASLSTEVENLKCELEQRNQMIAELMVFKNKWEGHIETETARSGSFPVKSTSVVKETSNKAPETSSSIKQASLDHHPAKNVRARRTIEKNAEPSTELKAE